jgi:ATP-binding cassette subfamily F protein uup
LDQEAALPAGLVGAVVGEGWEAAAVLERLGMGAYADRPTNALSGGQAKRVALARVLAAECELLILDEPTNQLDIGTVEWLAARLVAFRGGVVLVTHDRHLLDRVTTRMLELDRGHAYVHEEGYSAYLAAAAEREERAAGAESVRRNLARRELAWLRRGAPARTRKSKARIDSATTLIETRPEAAARSGDLDLGTGTPRLGDKVIECHGVGYAYPGGSPVLSDVTFALDPRERLGLVGANGTGKSTLLDLLAGRAEPTAGHIERGPTVSVGYYDQLGVTLDPQARVRDLVAGPTRPTGAPEDLKLMERFWFTGELQVARVATLSGGERRRLQLLLVLASRPNVLLLDEPTNDLDLDTLRTLEEFLEEWPGAAVMVSHDRTFLDRCVDRVMALRGTHLDAVPGGVAAWVTLAEAAGTSGAGGAGSAATLRRFPGSPTAARTTNGAPAGRSASTLGHLLREADRDVQRLHRRREQLVNELGTASDHLAMQRVGEELAQVSEDLGLAEERWLALAEEAEQR